MGLLKVIGLMVVFGFLAQIIGATLSVVAEETMGSSLPAELIVTSSNPEAMALWSGIGFVVVVSLYGFYKVIR